MSTTDPSPPAPAIAAAGAFLDTLTAGDFTRLAAVLEPDVALRALLPSGFREWQGVDEVCARFETWFGNADEFEVLDTAAAEVGPRLQLRWRLRIVAERLGDGERVVEQIVFADTGATGRIGAMSLLCSGYVNEHGGD